MKKCMSCHLTLRVDGRYYPAVVAPNGRIKPGVALVDGAETKLDGGTYYVEWREKQAEGEAKRMRLAVGSDATRALQAKKRKESELAARAHGLTVAPSTPASDVPANGNGIGRAVAEAVAAFLADVKEHRKKKTHSAYNTALTYFQEFCPRAHIEEITKEDLKAFSTFLRDKKGQSQRSVYNKFEVVMSFLKFYGIQLKKVDWPVFVEETPDAYEREELEKFFATCDEEERLWFKFFLMTGMREQEVMHTYWSDINFGRSVIKVSHKPDRNWTPKMYKERDIPVPTELIELLKAWHARRNQKCGLVFPTLGCRPKTDFLDCVKAVAERAGLEGDWFLHKFRATFATWHLWAGDLRTVQDWMGHKDLESTMRYLKPNKKAHAMVNATFAG
jgi:integrase/recombinase XerD